MDSNVGDRLSKDQWFAYNTLSLVFEYLNPPDLLRSCQVCKLWQKIAMEPSLWRSVKLDGCKLNFEKMSNALNELGSYHLKLHECIFVLNDNDLFNAVKKMPALRQLELSECSSKLVENLSQANRNLEVIKANIICGLIGLNLSLNFLLEMSNITDLKLYCNRELETPLKALASLKRLKHLYLLGVKNLSLINLQDWNLHHSDKLQTLGLGDCWNLSKTFATTFLKTLTSLKKLRLENCRECHIVLILESISHLNTLECLELIEINVDRGFDQYLKSCKNIKKLTIVPNPHRLKMAQYNGRIAAGVTSLKYTLKHFTWGFIPRYLEYTYKISEQKNSVPIIQNFSASDPPLLELQHWLEPLFVNLNDLQKMIANEITYTTVTVNCKEYSGSVFLSEV